MGLDMYLIKRTFIWTNHQEKKRELADLIIPSDGYKHIKPERIRQIEEEVAYWRKANHIHQWFVDNVQNGEDDCKDYYVSNEKLKELLAICKEVLKDNKKANELLSTKRGFFFGGTDYDEVYFSDTEHTVKIIESLLEEGENGEIYYSSSW